MIGILPAMATTGFVIPDFDAPASAGVPFSIWIAIVTAVLSTGAAAWFWWSLRKSSDARDLAFNALARRLRIPKRERQAIREQAEAIGVHPVALILTQPWEERASTN